jgi:hypothetical protein
MLTIGATNYDNEDIQKEVFDLKDHKCKRLRIHINIDGKYSLETRPRQKLLICEMDIPKRKYRYIEKVVNGETVTESEEIKLELEKISMKEYLKETKKK